MPLTLIDRNTVPPGGVSFWQAETRTRLTAPSVWYCAELVIKHRVANGLPTSPDRETVMLEIEDQLCKTMPPNVCRDPQGVVKVSGKDSTLATIIRGAETLGDFFFRRGRPRVTIEQATERARVCGNCFANKKPEGCTPCNSAFIQDLIVKMVGGEASTPHDNHLHACAYCGCLLRAKVHVKLDVLLDHTPPEQLAEMPDFCWLKTEQQPPQA